MSQKAIDFIKRAEGLSLDAYTDSAGIWTIGYGHTGRDVIPKMRITEPQAEELLRKDMSWALATVSETVKVTLTDEQHAAITSLIFNIGMGAWRNSTVLRRLNAGDYSGAAEAIPMWNKITVGGQKVVSKGLAIRRERERALFMTSEIGTDTEAASRGNVAGGEIKPQVQSKTQWLAGGGILTSVLAVWGQVKDSAPEIVELVLPYLPYALVAIFAGVMVNRYLDSRKGVH